MGGSSSKPGQVASSGTMEFVNSAIRDNKVVVFLKPNCPFCVRVKKLFGDVGVPIFVVDITRREDMSDIQSCLEEKTGARSVPRVFINGESIGGCDQVLKMHDLGKLVPKLVEVGALDPAHAP